MLLTNATLARASVERYVASCVYNEQHETSARVNTRRARDA